MWAVFNCGQLAKPLVQVPETKEGAIVKVFVHSQQEILSWRESVRKRGMKQQNKVVTYQKTLELKAIKEQH